MEINTAELCLVYKEIKNDPDSWYQGDWAVRRAVYNEEIETLSCGTAYCFAGHTVVRNGDQVKWSTSSDLYATANSCTTREGMVTGISARAQEILGLDTFQCAVLFAPDNSLEDIRSIIEEYTGVDPEQ